MPIGEYGTEKKETERHRTRDKERSKDFTANFSDNGTVVLSST